MALETGVTYIDDLVSTNPVGATDNVDEGDDHIRNIKTAIQGSFPNLGATAVTATAAEINDLPTKTGTETLTNKTLTAPVIDKINDANGNESIIIGTTASAVNEITVTNAATGNAPVIQATGETNVDLELARRGTGDITIDSVPIYGMVILDTPELLVSDLTPPTSATAVNSTTLNAASANKAILSVNINNDAAVSLYFSGATFSPSTANEKVHLSSSGKTIKEFTVNLDGNNDFWYMSSDGSISAALTVYLIGYYV